MKYVMAGKQRLMIYGATGFMGKLIARLAHRCGMQPVLAGRDANRLADLGAQLGLPYRSFSLETPTQREQRFRSQRLMAPRDRGAASPNPLTDAALDDIQVVLNTAGPFSETALPLARACLRTRTHYLDICGEYDIFRVLDDLNPIAISRGVVIVPGVGLTVLASDALIAQGAAMLQTQRTEPHVVRVALSRVPFISRGSAKTMLDSVRDGLLLRRNGQLQVSSLGTQVRGFSFDVPKVGERREVRVCTALTLADLSSAGRTASTYAGGNATPDAGVGPYEVRNVETYVEASSLELASYEVAGNFGLALRSPRIKRLLDGVLSMWPEGPTEAERGSSRQQIVVEVEDQYRRMAVVRLDAPNSYDFTALVAVQFARLVQRRLPDLRGFFSPAQLFKPAELLTDPRSPADASTLVAQRSQELVGFK